MKQKNIKKRAVTLNSNVENTANEMNNAMRMLFDMKSLYFYNPVIPFIRDNQQVISWNNHISGRVNCGNSFTTLEQYKHILQSNSFHCIMYDGSLLRSSFVFHDNKIVNHSHLWWPSPYNYGIDFSEEITPQIMYEEFISDSNWMKVINMRSPVRIDFDPSSESKTHPAVHMHTQNNECRIKLDNPICFNQFIKFIFQNFYPEIELNFKNWNMLKYTYEKSKIDDYQGSCILL